MTGYVRRLLMVLPVLILFACMGCERQSTETDPNHLTHIYAPMGERIGNEQTITASGIWPVEDGYACVLYDSNQNVISVGDKREASFTIYHMDKTGMVTDKIPVQLSEIIHSPGKTIVAGDRGAYFFSLTNVGRELIQIDWQGNLVCRVDSADFKPAGVSSVTPEAVVEMKTGLALIWGRKCVVLDEKLQKTGEIDLPGNGDTLFAEEDTIWLSYEEKGVRTLGKAVNGVITDSWSMPESFHGVNVFYWTNLIGCRDGWLYGWDRSKICRWQFTAEDKEPIVETVFDFLNSGISNQKIHMITMLPEKENCFTLQMTQENGISRYQNMYKPAPDKDLSAMTVLTLACNSTTEEMEQAVIRFNQTHSDAYIKVVSYDHYDTAADVSGGYNRFQLDLTTGILQADILYGTTHNSVDLYPLMTGQVQKEDIAQCVKNAYEQDGSLYGIGSGFTLYSLVGREDTLGGRNQWNLAEFLDFYKSLPEGEYLMEDVGQNNASYQLFQNQMYASFLQEGRASFTDPLYISYLEFLSSLPEEGRKYMDHGTNNMASILSGDMSAEHLQVEEAGENLYHNGKIKLTKERIQTVSNLLGICRTFNTTELNFIGFPTVSENGIFVNMSNQYSITKNCKNPALAWEFIEDILLTAGKLPDIDTVNSQKEFSDVLNIGFTTLTEPYMSFLGSLSGVQYFRGYNNSFQYGWEIELDENDCLNGQPGTLQTVDQEIISLIEGLYRDAGNRDQVPDQVFLIAYEEESKYLAGAISAEQCADNVQSRVNIYLSETE